jgi:hypothetical protein
MLSVGFQMHLASHFNPLQLQGKYILRARGVGREQSGPDLFAAALEYRQFWRKTRFRKGISFEKLIFGKLLRVDRS